MSKLVEFYLGRGVDSEGRRLEDIWAWDDERWEDAHDFIQWLFPTVARSAFNSRAPEVTEADITVFRSTPALQDHLRKSFHRFLRDAGLVMCLNNQVTEGDNFAERSPEMWQYDNHNWLRISRVLASLRTFGLDAEAAALFAWLDSAYSAGIIGSGDATSRREAAISHAVWMRNALE